MKPASTPLPTKLETALNQAATSSKDADNELYRSIIGSLMYAQVLTRCDIAYAVSKLSQYLTNPKQTHPKLAYRVLAYLYHTRNDGIIYNEPRRYKFINFFGYSDADFAGDLSNRKSTTGWCFMYNGGAISWRSNKQSCVALSTSEAEYVAISDAGKEARSLRKLQSEFLNIDINSTQNYITIYEDNRFAENWTRNPAQPAKTKQTDISYHHTGRIRND